MSKPSPAELGSPQFQRQMQVSTYLLVLELFEVQLKFWAGATDEELDVLDWTPSIFNIPMPRDIADESYRSLWERAIFEQQRPHREHYGDSLGDARRAKVIVGDLDAVSATQQVDKQQTREEKFSAHQRVLKSIQTYSVAKNISLFSNDRERVSKAQQFIQRWSEILDNLS